MSTSSVVVAGVTTPLVVIMGDDPATDVLSRVLGSEFSRIPFSILNEATGIAVNKEPVSTSTARVAAFEVFSAKELKSAAVVVLSNVEVLVTVLSDVAIVLILVVDLVDALVLVDSLVLELSPAEGSVISNLAVGTVCLEGLFILVAFVVVTVVFANLFVATLVAAVVVFLPLIFVVIVVTLCLSTALLGVPVTPLTLIDTAVFAFCVVDISKHFSTVHLHLSVIISYTLPSVQLPSSRAASWFPFP